MVTKIEVLVGDLFRYVLHKNDIYSEENLKLNESPPISEDSEFTEEIGRAVLVFSYVYRVMFKNRFYKSAMVILRRTAAFDAYVQTFCSRSTANSDYFMEFLVTLSFVTELAAYCYVVGSSNFCSLPAEAFMKVFNNHMEPEFLARGGFEKLQESATRLSRPYEILEMLIQTESPANDILPILEGAAYLGLGVGFFTAEKVNVKEPEPEPEPETKKKKKKKRKKEAKSAEPMAAEPKAAEVSSIDCSGELEISENDVILDKIIESVTYKYETGTFSTIIPGASRTENWPEFHESDASGDTSEAAKDEDEQSQEEFLEVISGATAVPASDESEEIQQEQPEAELPRDVQATEECQDDKASSDEAEVQGATASNPTTSVPGKKYRRKKRKNKNARR